MKPIAVPLAALFLATTAIAQSEAPEPEVTSDMSFPADAEFKHSFDAYESEAGKPNGAFARALAMHRALEAAGVEADNIRTAIVVHGPAVFDVVNDARYGAKYRQEDGEPLRNQAYNDIAELIARGTEIWVCGVAAEYHGVGNADLLDGVKMAPSGTVAHAELQRRGFTINPY